MAEFIARVRLLIGDPDGASTVFSGQEIEDALAARQCGEDEYDAYAAAADLLEMWAAKEKLSFDFEVDGQSYKRTQKAQALLGLAREYRKKQLPQQVGMVRSDAVCG